MSSRQLYTERLDACHIRVLDILDADVTGDIACLLRTRPVKDSKPYDAISYVWGDPQQRELISCNGMKLTITLSLAHALRRVRDANEARVLWADALCINQNDQPEKNVQVSIMKSIYDNARRVFIWLGPDSDGDASLAIEMLLRAFRHAETELGGTQIIAHRVRAEQPSLSRAEELGFPAPDDERWVALARFINRDWFERVWIIQEASHPKKTTVLVGHAGLSIGFQQVSLAAYWLVLKGFVKLVPNLQRLTNVLLLGRIGGPQTSALLDLLCSTRRFRSTWNHDKIYALLGLCDEGNEERAHSRLRVDYGREFSDVYRDVVRHALKYPSEKATDKGRLAILNLVQNNDYKLREEPAFSSWVPRWHDVGETWILGWQTYALRLFDAAKSVGAAIEPHPDERTLVLQGLAISEVDFVSANLVSVADNSADMWSAITELWDKVRQRSEIISLYGDVEQAFAETVTSGETKDHFAQDLAQFTKYDLAAYWQGNCMFEDESRKKIYEEYGPEAAPSSLKDGANFGRTICRQRVFFTTVDGHMGIGFKAVKPRDVVCVLFGGITPFVLRKDGDVFKLIGECYVAGLMKGEAIKKQMRGELVEQKFCLV